MLVFFFFFSFFYHVFDTGKHRAKIVAASTICLQETTDFRLINNRKPKYPELLPYYYFKMFVATVWFCLYTKKKW